MLIRGDRLNPSQRRLALAMFVHRFTIDHPNTIGYAPEVRSKLVPTETDAEWLAAHAFAIRRGGELAYRNCYPACLAD